MRIEWPTLGLIVLCYGAFGLALWFLPVWAAVLVLMPVIALQASLQHEVLHGHPFGDRRLGEPLVFASLNLAIPYIRFRDTHLAHHMDANLTDPYDDPESNYLDPAQWQRLPRAAQLVLRVNNTLLGRMLIGPALAQMVFMAEDLRAIRAGAYGIASAWLAHGVACIAILALVAWSPLPIWAYLLACYGGLSILKIRTFLEHQAHDRVRGRTVIIEDRGVLAFLFLNNNLHVVHHMHPRLPWYRLPGIYFANRTRYLARNDGYVYRSYGEIFRRHLIRAKDPVAHPLYPQK
ncbi:fatty acid desaturase [Gymnodinialimonas sp. 2305UL16-5]|uniref:fatty acid desaturase n=1 Tax=Gymnodinialimonas mytili TaxID=3126503 RepID=UPI0030AED1B3